MAAITTTTASTTTTPTSFLEQANETSWAVGKGMIFNTGYHYSWLCFACLVIFANCIVFMIFKRDKKLLRRTPANNLLLSLAINDFLTGITSLLQLIPYLRNDLFKDQRLRKLHYGMSMDCSITFLSLNSVLHLCLLAIERYLSIFYALQFKGLVTTRRVRYSITVAWLSSLVIAVAPFTWQWPLFYKPISVQKMHKITRIDVYYSSIVTVTFCFLPLILLLLAYVRMFVFCKSLIKGAPNNLLSRKRTASKELKISLMYFVMYLVFIVLSVPFFSVRLAIDIYTLLELGKSISIPRELAEGFVLMRVLTSAFNPCIYTFYKRDFRLSIKSTCLYKKLHQGCCARRSTIRNNERINSKEMVSFGTQLTIIRKPPAEIGLAVSLTSNGKELQKTENPTINEDGYKNVSQRLLVEQIPTR